MQVEIVILPSMIIQLNNISKAYGSSGEANFQQVLQDLSMKIGSGESVAITGPSGSGKSTLLNILGTLDYPDAGSYTFKDVDVTGLKGKSLDHFRNREIGFVFQFHHLLPQLNVVENVLIPAMFSEDKKGAEAHAETLLRQVGMWEHRFKKPGQLSGGECQRVAVVRALINRPALLLADEPTGALDRNNVQSIADLLLEMNSNLGVTLLLVTHSLELAGKMSRQLTLQNGQLEEA